MDKLNENNHGDIPSQNTMINKDDIDGMASFFKNILSNPITSTQENAVKNESMADDKEAVDKPTDDKLIESSAESMRTSLTSEILRTSWNSEEHKPGTCLTALKTHVTQHDHRLNCSQTSSPNQTISSKTMSDDFILHQGKTHYRPEIPSPSRYGAIAALDEGDENKEAERWAERTETITRLEHEA